MRKILILIVCIFFYACISAQTEQEKLTSTILHLDSAFWNAYNNCDTSAYKIFFTDDVEFYHDKGGITNGAPALIESLSKNLCSNSNYHLRREAVAGTVKVYPMQSDNKVYGAIITGEHLFYVTKDGNPEYLDGDANFTHLWLLKDNVWKMARILSYNHHAAEYINTKKEISLSPDKLDALTGSYKSKENEELVIKRKDGMLILTAGNNSYMLYPQSPTSFFTKDRDLVFEFIKDENNKPIKIIIKEHGTAVDEAVLEK